MQKICSLTLFIATALSVYAQIYPSKEYVRLGSRVIAVEAAPILTPAGEMNASSQGEGQPGQAIPTINIAGSPSSWWKATSTANWITITSTAMDNTDTSGMATITYQLDPNTDPSGTPPRTGSIQVEMESGTAIYNISQLSGANISISLTPQTATALASGGSGSVSVQTSPNSLSWTATPQGCFTNPQNSISLLMGTGGAVINYSLVANPSTSPQTCSLTITPSGGGNPQTFTVTQAGAPGLSGSNPSVTLTGAGTYAATVSADGSYTVNVLNWTGWRATASVANPSVWNIGIPNPTGTNGVLQFNTTGGDGSGTITFTDGSTALILNLTESTVGGSCAPSPTLSLSSTSVSIPAAGGTSSVQVNSNTNWTASCTNADQEGLTFYISGNSTPGNCAAPLTGSGTQTLTFDLTYNHANPPGALSSTVNVTTCGGSAAQVGNITVAQGAEAFTITPGTKTIYQDFDNAAVQFTAYFDGGTTFPPNYTVSWSLSDPSGNSGTINSSGLYIPPNPVPTNFGSVTVTGRLSDGASATAVISVQANPYAPQASVTPNTGSGSGTNFQFEFNTLGNEPPNIALIQNATMVFSTTATSQNQTPTVSGCEMYIQPGYGVSYSYFEMGTQEASVETTTPGGTWSLPAVWNSDCSVNLRGTESTFYTWALSSGQATGPLFANIPIQFYQADAGLTGIWATSLENGNTTAYNLFLGNYTVSSPTETVSPASITLNTNGQTQQFTGLAAGTTPIPDISWHTPSAGTISSSGLYTAPNPLTTLQTISISGTRQSDGTSICCATVVLSPVSISVSPQTVSLSAGQTQSISATITGTSDQSVTWNTPSAGTFSNGVYTAPSSIPSQQIVTLTATSTVDPSKSASVTITLVPVAVSVTPASASLQINQTQPFVASVSGTTSQTVTWSLSPSGASYGSLSSAGVYTAPASIASGQTVTITATSTVDTTKTSSAQITLIPDTLSILPAAGASLAQGQSQQFTASVSGATNTTVSWSINPSVGTISSGGYYTAPTTIAAQQTIVVTATSQADPSLSKSVSVILNPPVTMSAGAGTPQSATVGASFAATLQATVLNTSNNPIAGITVTFTAPNAGASATFSGSLTATAITNSSGVATSPALTANTIAGNYLVIASAAGAMPPASFSLTNLAGAPATVTSTAGTPQTATIGASFTAALQAIVKDANGNPVSGVTVTFTAPSSGASGTFGGSTTTTATTNSSGVATSPTLTANTIAGAYTVAATVSGVGTAANFSLTNNAGPPASIVTSAGTPQSTTVGVSFGTAVQATVRDASNNPVSGVTVTFTAPNSGATATFSGSMTATATTNSSGAATAPALTANTTPGNYTVTANVSGVGTAANFSLSNNAGPASSITASAGTPQTTTVGTAFPTTLQATVKDAYNNPLSGLTVTFSAPTSGASATFGGLSTATATTNASGLATSSVLAANTIAGPYSITASVSGVGTPATFSMTNLAGPPASVVATAGTPQSAALNTAFAIALQASVRDANNNPLSGVTVTFTAPSSGATATFSGSTTATVTTNSTGVAIAPTATANTTAGSYTVTATVAGVGTPASYSLTNNVPVYQYSVTLTSGNAWIAPLSITSVQAECIGGGGGGGKASDGHGGGGGAYARRNSVAVTQGNTYSYTIGSGGSGSVANSSDGSSTIFTGDSGGQCVAAGGSGALNGGTGGATSASSGDVVFGGGNGTSGSSGHYGGGGGSSAGFSSSGNDGNQQSGGAAVAGGGPGGNGGSTGDGSVPSTGPGGGGGGNGARSVGGNGAAGQITLTYTSTLTAGSPTSIGILAGTPQTAMLDSAFSSALQVIVEDIAGNPLSGVTVTFTAPGTGASATFGGLTTATAITNSSGVATSPTPTANTILGGYTVMASVSGVPTVASFSLTNVPVVIVLTSGSSWTAPAGVTSIQVECVGGGGGGASAYASVNGFTEYGAGGGGGGAYARRNAMAVTPGNAYTYTIGAGGAGGANGNFGGVGGTTTFTGDNAVKCKAGGGGSEASTLSGGAGGTTVVGDVTHPGGAGASGTYGPNSYYGGGGGGSGGSSSAGQVGSGSTGGTAVAGGGPGGNGGLSPNFAGQAPGSGAGGGGGGSLSSGPAVSGGNGAHGQITITYSFQ